jgi:hypothetical protein
MFWRCALLQWQTTVQPGHGNGAKDCGSGLDRTKTPGERMSPNDAIAPNHLVFFNQLPTMPELESHWISWLFCRTSSFAVHSLSAPFTFGVLPSCLSALS